MGSRSEGQPIRLMLVDDHPLWMQTLGRVFQQSGAATVVAEATDGDEALAIVVGAAPDVIVMDINLPTIDGIETTGRILATLPDARVLILSGSESREDVVAAVQAGAAGYVLKTIDSTEVVNAVKRIDAGEIVFPPALADVVLQEFRRRAHRPTAEGGQPALPPTVTLVFTDVEDSTTMAERAGAAWPDVLHEHRELLRSCFGAQAGSELTAIGDACVWEFARASEAVRAAAAAQRAFAVHDWGGRPAIRVRIGLHTGEPDLVDDAYEGADLNRGSRICDAGHGGQVLCSQVTASLVGSRLPAGLSLRAAGTHVLRGFTHPEQIFELVIDGAPHSFPPLRSAYARPVGEPVVVLDETTPERTA